MKDYCIEICFNYKDSNSNETGKMSVEHCFYNQPNEIDEDLLLYWLLYLNILLNKLYNTKEFSPVYKEDNSVDIGIDKPLDQIEENKLNTEEDLNFHLDKYLEEMSCVFYSNDGLLKARKDISAFEKIDNFFTNIMKEKEKIRSKFCSSNTPKDAKSLGVHYMQYLLFFFS